EAVTETTVEPSASAEERVRQFLLSLGTGNEEIDAAIEDESLDLLVVDRLLIPPNPSLTPAMVSEATGMSLENLARLWRALGFPDVADDEVAFTELDLEAITSLQELLSLGLVNIESTVQLTRVIGTSMARIAEAEVGVGPVIGGEMSPAQRAELFALSADGTLPSIVRLIEYTWRRHLQAAGRRAMLTRGRAVGSSGQITLAVGFADLVGFTAMSQELDQLQLAELVDRFEALAYETVTILQGRVVKMIGDEVMYVADDVVQAARIAISLAEAYADDEVLSEVRVGLAYGSVLARDGDYYGPVVNLASRMVNITRPGRILISQEVFDALNEVAEENGEVEFGFKSLRMRYLKDIGRVNMWSLTRPAGSSERFSL
ncbi:MAG: adenylate/guanylate cyclase domain-containing protein, partial [Acidimicrobiales bacterium]